MTESAETENLDQAVSEASIPSRLLQELESKRSRLLADAILAVIRAQVETQPPGLQARFDGVSMLSIIMNVLDLFHRSLPRHMWMRCVGEAFLVMADSETPKNEANKSEPEKEPCNATSTSV